MKKILYHAATLITLITIAATLNATPPAAVVAGAASLCDGCPLQEICADTTAGVEVLSCDNNAAATAPVPPSQMDMATAIVNEESAAGNTSEAGVSAADATASVTISASRSTSGAGDNLTHLPAANDTCEISTASFAGLAAYATSSENGLILTIKGGTAEVETLLSKFSEKFSIKNGAEKEYDLLVAASGEVTMKINRGTEAEKISFLESLGIKFEK